MAAWPEAAKEKDSNGDTPLHIFLCEKRSVSKDALNILLAACVESKAIQHWAPGHFRLYRSE
eukprot:1071439-Ditylum_brightwellii.AAC.1